MTRRTLPACTHSQSLTIVLGHGGRSDRRWHIRAPALPATGPPGSPRPLVVGDDPRRAARLGRGDRPPAQAPGLVGRASRARLRGPAALDARASPLALELVRRPPLRVVERRARTRGSRRAAPDVPHHGRRARHRGPRAGRGRPRTGRDRAPARRLSLQRVQLLERARLPWLRRAADLPHRRRLPRVHPPPALGRPSVEPGGSARGDPRLDARARPPADLPRLDAVARAPGPLGGREPALAECRGRVRVLPRHAGALAQRAARLSRRLRGSRPTP